MDTDDKKPVGAPKQLEGGKRHNVYLDWETVRVATQAGQGNMSEGLREVARFYKANAMESAK